MSYIRQVLEHYGAEFNGVKCCCPLHGEATPSLQIYEDTESWFCFGSCGKGGDAIEFVKEIDGVDFKEALKTVCEILEISEEEWLESKDEEKPVVKIVDNGPMRPGEAREFAIKTGFKAKGYRSIRDEINMFYGHCTQLDASGNVSARYYPETNSKGEVTGFKCRNHPKDFSYGKIGFTGAKSQLSGQFKFNSGGKYVLLVGGEEDKAAAYQMLKDSQKEGFTGIAVVSPTSGETSAAKQCAAQYDFLDQYEIIIVGMDNDDAGNKAAIEIAKVLPKEKVRIAKWSGKDPNQMLMTGMQNQFIRDFYSAKEIVSSGISTSADAEAGLEQFLTAAKIGLPPQLHRLQAAMRGGIKSTGAVVNIIGDTSIGKCHGKDTPILMADMSVKMVQDICVGDEVMGDDGSARKVLNTVRGVENLYEIQQVRGMNYVVNESHILSLRAGYDCKNSGAQKGDVVNITIKDFIASGNKLKRSLKGYKGDMVKLGSGSKTKHPWLLGLWLADGTTTAPSISIAHKDIEILNAVKKECDTHGYSVKAISSKESCDTYYISGGFKEYLKEFNLIGNKHIPKEYLLSCYKDRVELISGLLDGDGYLVSNGYEITQKSLQLSTDIIKLAKSLCLDSTTREKVSRCQNDFEGTYQRTFLYGKTDRLNLRLTRKRVIGKSTLRGDVNTAITVKPLGEGEYFGFNIDGNRLYCLEDGTVTHNSFLSDTFLYEWIFNSPLVPTVVSLERTKEELTIDLLSMHLKKNLMWFSDGHDAVEYLNRPDVQLLKNELLYNEEGKPRFFIIDEREGDIELLKRQMEKSGKVNDSTLMVIDPLTDFLRSLGTEIQENFMMWQKLQKKNGYVFINILHTRKPPTDKDGNVRKVSEYDALGSGTFIQSADINIVINRDKMSDDPVERNTTYVDMPKCRGGTTGEICALYYDAETRQQYDRDDYFANKVDNVPPLPEHVVDWAEEGGVGF